jgi:uncharacterized protein (DUF1778 family)
MMAPNKTNHPPRKGVEIEKHKGGRTARLNTRFTEAEKAEIMAVAHAAGLSVSDFILTHPAINTANTACTGQAASSAAQ